MNSIKLIKGMVARAFFHLKLKTFGISGETVQNI